MLQMEFILMNAVPFSFKQMKEIFSLICKQNLWTRTDIWKIGHGIFYENYFLLLNFSINCPVLYDFIHVYSFFSSCYCILGDFFSIVYTYIIFFSLSCNGTDCLHSLLKRNDLNSSTKWNLFSRLYYVICNCH